ncbi:MarR family winged helix-turn-helix transcriptional regulator [Conexibacter arvalis]|uniref:DNA-binding MarR family transcriptional regulator n=1 Tax=Conexibacter arvalis TaxID=912552 RepID=A0A840IFS3_9ACTN|nr:MarR family transcriptional regulator [Conexibacter arvalis]MBB4663043.1 DNA-binding MarR family transcriptional regulator [Conexibacter arvalis]
MAAPGTATATDRDREREPAVFAAADGLDAETAAFVEAWRRFSRATQKAKARRFDDGTLSLTQALLLSGLLDEPELTVGALAERAEVSKPTATRMLDGLERDGYVTRRPCARDRRVVLIALTAEGERALQARWRAFCDHLERASRRLSAEERAAATPLLLRLAALMDDF